MERGENQGLAEGFKKIQAIPGLHTL